MSWDEKYSNTKLKNKVIHAINSYIPNLKIIKILEEYIEKEDYVLKGDRILDLGCGTRKHPHSIGLDRLKLDGVDVVADFEKGIPFKDNVFDCVIADHSLEHVSDIIGTLKEIWRVCKDNAIVIIKVPHYSSHTFWVDPTHNINTERYFSYDFFDYFKPGHHKMYNFGFNFVILNKKLNKFRNKRKNPLMILLHCISNILANKSPKLFENFWCYWLGGFQEIIFELKVIKTNNKNK